MTLLNDMQRKRMAAAVPSPNGHPSKPQAVAPWEAPLPIGGNFTTPPLPLECFPTWLADWIAAEAEAKQTPADLGAMLALSVCAAGLATNFVACPRDGW